MLLLASQLWCCMELLAVPIHELSEKCFEVVRVLVEPGVQCVQSIGKRLAKALERCLASVAIRWWSGRRKQTVRLFSDIGGLSRSDFPQRYRCFDRVVASRIEKELMEPSVVDFRLEVPNAEEHSLGREEGVNAKRSFSSPHGFADAEQINLGAR